LAATEKTYEQQLASLRDTMDRVLRVIIQALDRLDGQPWHQDDVTQGTFLNTLVFDKAGSKSRRVNVFNTFYLQTHAQTEATFEKSEWVKKYTQLATELYEKRVQALNYEWEPILSQARQEYYAFISRRVTSAVTPFVKIRKGHQISEPISGDLIIRSIKRV